MPPFWGSVTQTLRLPETFQQGVELFSATVLLDLHLLSSLPHLTSEWNVIECRSSVKKTLKPPVSKQKSDSCAIFIDGGKNLKVGGSFIHFLTVSQEGFGVFRLSRRAQCEYTDKGAANQHGLTLNKGWKEALRLMLMQLFFWGWNGYDLCFSISG